MHAWINITHPGFSGRQDMPDDGDQWVSWEQMVATMRAKGEAEGRAAMLAREVVELRGEVAKLKQVPAVVVPDDDRPSREFLENYVEGFDPGERSAALFGWREGSRHLREHSRAIPADRALGEGMVAVDRKALDAFAEKAAFIRRYPNTPPEYFRLEAIFKGGAPEVLALIDALRANQGGLNHVHV